MTVTALAGGVGGARFLRGLTRRTDPRDLTVVVNTADDQEFFGLHVSPDVDTILYTLAGRADPKQGWGIAGDTFRCLGALGELGQPTWFKLGDRDLATHLFRTERLRRGWSLTRITRALAKQQGVASVVLPMTDDPVRTFVHTADHGRLPFQEYLVAHRARGAVTRIEIRGMRSASPAPGVIRAIERADVLIVPPSNPLVSVGPILGVPGVRRALRRRRKPSIAISPIVGRRPIRGPLHRMLRGLGHRVSLLGVAAMYAGLVDAFVLDERDRALQSQVEALGMRAVVTDIVMPTPAAAARLASKVLHGVHPPGR